MKKLIAMLVVGGFLAATLIGCGPATTSESKGAGPGPTGTAGATPKVVTTTGKVTKAEKGKLTVKPDSGEEKTFTIPDEVKIGDDVKVDATVTVTETDGKVTKVEKK